MPHKIEQSVEHKMFTVTVVQINIKEKLVCVQPYDGKSLEKFWRPIWKKSTDRMFSEFWRYA